MSEIQLTEDELRLVHQALHAYLNDFGHEEADVGRVDRTAREAQRRSHEWRDREWNA